MEKELKLSSLESVAGGCIPKPPRERRDDESEEDYAKYMKEYEERIAKDPRDVIC